MLNLISQLKRHEGLSLKPYKCTANKLTIGYGRNLEDCGISEEEAEFLLTNDINKVSSELNKCIPYFKNIPKEQRFVLVNMAFNIGVYGLLHFRNMLDAVERGDYIVAAEEMMNSKWARQVPNRAKELAEQMKTGVMK